MQNVERDTSTRARPASRSITTFIQVRKKKKSAPARAVVVPVWRDFTPIWLDDLSCASIDVSFRETPTCCNRTPT